MLIRLYDLPSASAAAEDNADRPQIRAPIGPEHDLIRSWVAEKFSAGWASEAGVALANRPSTLFVAQRGMTLIGFACFDATARGFFGPIGVDDRYRAMGVGTALLIRTLQAMRDVGYGYAIVGGVSAAEFYRKAARAVEIRDSGEGVYRNALRYRAGDSPA